MTTRAQRALMQNPENLTVYARSIELATATYRVTADFPASERFGLTNQMRRAAVSVGSNIAEGCGRGSEVEFVRFLQIALGSATELAFQIVVATELAMSASEPLARLATLVVEIRKMLSRLIVSIRARVAASQRAVPK